MPDLFASVPRSVGYGNAMILADLAEGVPNAVTDAKIASGEYPHIHTPSIPGWRALAGRR